MINNLAHKHRITNQNRLNLLETVDFLRQDATKRLDKDRKSDLGQFFTPAPVAHLLASMPERSSPIITILDAGAGVGSLFSAYIAQLCEKDTLPKQVNIIAYEIDETLQEYLQETMHLCEIACEQAGIRFTGEILQKDFIADGVELLAGTLFAATSKKPEVTCAILNPPYKKIQTGSTERKLLQRIGVETTNLYTGFLAIATQLLAPGGELVAITPRSFCNGPYFKNFRKNFLETMSLRRIHVYDSRKKAFSDNDVLQENIILHAVKEREKPSTISISSSSGPEDDFVLVHEVEYTQVVYLEDPEAFIRVVQDDLSEHIVRNMRAFHASLGELGLQVSTGRVVDFRATDFLRPESGLDTVPLLFPTHVSYGSITWPKPDSKKPNALLDVEQSKTLQVPNEYYVLVKRFSSKEEKKRIVAAVYDPTAMPGESVGFENHLNYFHRNGRGLPPILAQGLTAYLNSTLVDSFFRQFNGHTQVNATDLRNIKYPSLQQLEALGRKITDQFPDQHELDQLIKEELLDMSEEGKEYLHTNDPIQTKQKIEQALSIIKDLGLERGQQNERSALTLLVLLNLKPDTPWSRAESPLCGITPMMDFFREHYGKDYKPNTRETVRRQSVHQFLEAGIIIANPDDPDRPVNSPKAVYQIEQGTLELLRTYGTDEWDTNLRTYLSSVETLKRRYAQEREMRRIPVTLVPGKSITLSPGGQNILVEQIINSFAPYYTPGGKVLYVGDTDMKFAYFDEVGLTALGVTIELHGKMPDVIIHHVDRNWLVLIEAVTSHGPIDGKRKDELKRLFCNSSAGLVFVTAFLTRKAMVEYLKDISCPRYPESRYPLDYGYLEGTRSGDGDGIDVWIGSFPEKRATAIIFTVDLEKRDGEIKILLGCTHEEMHLILAYHRVGSQSAVLLER
jgi:adenine-specific DNA-methyltransferase